MSVAPDKPEMRIGEFVTLMAMMISLVALSIDAMLPALPAIGADLGVIRVNDNQLVLSVLFLGLAIGQTIYGPVSDSIGRKPAIYAGLTLFIAGCILSIIAGDFATMLAGRFLQGVGAAGPRIVCIALVRDQYEGRAMARIMSFVMAVFILVPALAPALGQGLLLLADWRIIFVSFLALALIAFVWFAIRQTETLPPDKRTPFSVRRISGAVKTTFTNRAALGYTIAAGLIFGAFVGFLTSVQQIFQVQYALGTQFPAYFAALALTIGSASVVNARLVMRFGMRYLSTRALWALSSLSVIFATVAFLASGHPPFWALMAFLIASFFCFGILFGNFNALAMESLGHIAGTAAAVIGSLTTFISLFLGSIIGQAYDNSILPLVSGFACLSIASLITMYRVERKNN